MARKPVEQPTFPRNCTIYVRFPQEDYSEILQQPQLFRQHLDRWHEQHPELFPTGFQDGYRLKDIRHSKKLNVSYRRIRLRNNRLCTIYPSFVMPYMTALTDEVSTILFLARLVEDSGARQTFERAVFRHWQAGVGIYRCENKEKMRRSIDSLRRWPKRNLTGVVLEKVLNLCSKKRQWTKHLEHRRCHRTSKMLDRLIAPK